jgi:asparaginyl-tRNA synthetase
MSRTCQVTQRIPDETPYPIQLKEAGVDFLMEHRHLWLRTPRQSAILRVRATIMRAAAEYFDTNGFIRTDPPILTPNACEGTSELFEMDYFDDDKAYLTQSGQLYIEATALALGKVYSFGPTFRAEKSKTRRHLTEFWMIEPEVCYMDLDGLMDAGRGVSDAHRHACAGEASRDLKVIGKDVAKLEAVAAPGHEGSKTPRSGFPPELRRGARDAARRARQGLLENAHTYGDDFGSPDETYISNQFDKPVMVHRYPAAVKAFYMQPDPQDPTKALCVDVLAPEGYGEIIGGSQRVDSYDLLKSRIEAHGLPMDAFQWYLDLRKYGSVPHSGFGMGIERCVAWICGLEHVRETIPFARTLNRIYPLHAEPSCLRARRAGCHCVVHNPAGRKLQRNLQRFDDNDNNDNHWRDILRDGVQGADLGQRHGYLSHQLHHDGHGDGRSSVPRPVLPGAVHVCLGYRRGGDHSERPAVDRNALHCRRHCQLDEHHQHLSDQGHQHHLDQPGPHRLHHRWRVPLQRL